MQGNYNLSPPHTAERKMLSKVAWMSFCSAKFSSCADDICWGNTHFCSWGKYLSGLIISAIRAKILSLRILLTALGAHVFMLPWYRPQVTTRWRLKVLTREHPRQWAKFSVTPQTVRILARMAEIIKHDRYFPQLQKWVFPQQKSSAHGENFAEQNDIHATLLSIFLSVCGGL